MSRHEEDVDARPAGVTPPNDGGPTTRIDDSLPTRAPLYLGSVRAEALCDHHGEMIRQGPPVVRRDGRVFAAREGVSLFSCPECCLDLAADAGDSTGDPDQVAGLLWRRYLDDGWDDATRDLLVDLGPGRLEPGGVLSVVLSEDDAVDEAIVPEYLSGHVGRLLR